MAEELDGYEELKDYAAVLSNTVAKLYSDLAARDYAAASYDLTFIASISSSAAKAAGLVSLSEVRSFVVPPEIVDKVNQIEDEDAALPDEGFGGHRYL